MATRPRLLFVVTEDWYFVSHRLDLASAAATAGFEVGIATRVKDHAKTIEERDVRLFPLRFMRRSSRNPWTEYAAINELTTLYRQWRPTITHHVAAKPVVYGGIAAQRAGVPATVNALAGLGFVFSSASLQARALRPMMLLCYRRTLRHPHSRLIVQNKEDEALALAQRLTDSSSIRRIAGSGVNTSTFAPTEEPRGRPVFILAARMLTDKGVHEFVEAARIAHSRGVIARFVLVGDADTENPAAISTNQLRRWNAEGAVEWWGHRADMPAVFRMAHVVCLPSYREGLPKVLLEAAACGRPVIASDVPGCREIAVQHETALLVPPRDSLALAAAMQTLAGDAQLRTKLGRGGRELVSSRFTVEHVNGQTIAAYQELLHECKAS